jgi:hypothetical protein
MAGWPPATRDGRQAARAAAEFLMGASGLPRWATLRPAAALAIRYAL